MTEKEREAAGLEAQIADVCGLLNATTGRLVSLIARVLATGAWEGWRIRSPEHWVAWKCGVSPSRARALVTMARRLDDRPETRQAFEAGELCEDQVAVVCRHAPPSVDAQVAEFARAATVTQLRRALGGYTWEPEPAAGGEAQPPAEPPRQVSFNYTDEGTWRLSALLPAEDGALLDRALTEARTALVKAGDKDATWADALLSLARAPGQRQATALLHLDSEGSHLHLGPAVSPGLSRYLSCDATIKAVLERGGTAVSVGRASRTVPDRTRTVIEERDRGCRVPGCPRTKWLHCHHIHHWEDGGPTDTANLIALCSKHHRLHHLGLLGISGNADQPDGVTFTDHRGRPLTPFRQPDLPPSTAADLDIPDGNWAHPTGDYLDAACVYFN